MSIKYLLEYIFLMSENKFFENAICGAGPAGMGLVICAYQNGLFNKMLDKGIVLIDEKSILGIGSLGDYHITANSLGKVFLEFLERVRNDPNFSNLMNHPYVKKLDQQREDAPALSSVAKYLGLLSENLIHKMKANQNCRILSSTNIHYIQQHESGLYEINIKVKEKNSSHTGKIYARNVILNLGGKQNPDDYLYRRLWSNFNLLSYKNKVIPSGTILKLSYAEFHNTVLPGFSRIMIVGGSHSAFSVALRLFEEAKINPEIKREIHILHRNDIKLFFNDKSEATKANYSLDEEKDICPLSKKVNRFSGLRYNAFNFAVELLKSGHIKNETCEIKLVPITVNSSSQKNKFLESLFENANLIIPCFGYQANLVPLYNNLGFLIPIKQETDGLSVNNKGQIYTKNNYLIPNMYSYGLGSGLRRSERVGGEPSFQGRLDGVWLYQNDVGRIILEQIL